MRRYVYSTPSDEPFTAPDEEDLGYPFSTAVLLWTAWRDHGVMAVAGGLLDQPRRWRDTIGIMNDHHAPIQQQYMNEQRGDHNNPPSDNVDNWIEDGVDMGTPMSFDRLKG